MNPSEDPEDRLLDSLLREQARGTADEELLNAIEARIGAEPLAARRPSPLARAPWLGAAAASVALAFGVVVWRDKEKAELAETVARHAEPVQEAPAPAAERSVEVPEPVPVRAEGRDDSAAASQMVDAAPPAPSPMPLVEASRAEFLEFDSTATPDLAGGRTNGAGPGSGAGAGRGAAPRQRVVGPASAVPVEESEQMLSADASARAMGGSDAMAGLIAPPGRPPIVEPHPIAPPDGTGTERYGQLVDQPWKSPWQDALSTFSIDVDTASYTNVRRMIQDGTPVPKDAVRIEELVNYFDYGYAGPQQDRPFAVHGTLATSPWHPQHLLARVAIKGREIDAKARPASNLVFLIDVSGSMQDANKLPLLKRSMRLLLDQLDERDRLGIVVYASGEGVVLDPTRLDERGLSAAIQALEKLEAGGSTNGGAGIKRAYEMAARNLVPGGVNRVILATDGDFNVGTTGQGDLVTLVKEGASKGVSLSVLGLGTGNLNDSMLEAITNDGNGNYFYIDGDQEARRVFQQNLTGTLVTIAKDVKIQVEFNPGKVAAYRLIGYANRILRHEDFNNDKVDAGDIGAGHTVTAFYEIVPVGVPVPETGTVDGLRYQRPAGREVVPSDDWFTLKLRYKHPEGDVSSLIDATVKGEPQPWEQAGHDFRFASAVALFGMKLREMPEVADITWQRVVEIARPALAEDPQEERAGFVEMVSKKGGVR